MKKIIILISTTLLIHTHAFLTLKCSEGSLVRDLKTNEIVKDLSQNNIFLPTVTNTWGSNQKIISLDDVAMNFLVDNYGRYFFSIEVMNNNGAFLATKSYDYLHGQEVNFSYKNENVEIILDCFLIKE